MNKARGEFVLKHFREFLMLMVCPGPLVISLISAQLNTEWVNEYKAMNHVCLGQTNYFNGKKIATVLGELDVEEIV